jgi:hypothetical protein
MCGLDTGGDVGCSPVCGELGCEESDFIVAFECGAAGSCLAPPVEAPAASRTGLIVAALTLAAVAVFRLARRAR